MARRKTALTEPRRSRSRNELEHRECNNCKKPFKPKRDTQRYCSQICRRVARNVSRRIILQVTHCLHCSKELIGKRSHAKYCSDFCRRSAFKDKNGR